MKKDVIIPPSFPDMEEEIIPKNDPLPKIEDPNLEERAKNIFIYDRDNDARRALVKKRQLQQVLDEMREYTRKSDKEKDYDGRDVLKEKTPSTLHLLTNNKTKYLIKLANYFYVKYNGT